MSSHQLLQQLRQLKLTGIADALDTQINQPNTYDDLGFIERLELLVGQEMTYRENKRLQRLLRGAKFKLSARLEDIDYAHPRGLKKTQIATLQTGEWIAKHHNLAMTGPTGCGKTYLACALGYQACLQGYSVRYFRASRLFEALTLSHGDGSYLKFMGQLAKVDVLLIDDWGLEKLTQSQRNDLLELMDDRHATRSTVITSQLPVSQWHDFIGDPTLADAILDRVLHSAHKLNLKGQGDSMRKKHGALPDNERLD